MIEECDRLITQFSEKEITDEVKKSIEQTMAQKRSLLKQLNDEVMGHLKLRERMALEIIQYQLNYKLFNKYLAHKLPPTMFYVPEEFLNETNDLNKVSCFGNVYDKYLFNHWIFFRNIIPRAKEHNPINLDQFREIIFGCTDLDTLRALSKKYDLYLRDFDNYYHIESLMKTSKDKDTRFTGYYYHEKQTYILSIYQQYAREIFRF